ncbi:manganese efflux pump [Sporosarcina sp. 6E9]|uniref:manganese efflux pump MntP n=1 Tax=Sporosarcina sp. 6E9 TaxID=2819235 RepID=UPI001B300F31|nr:manganese efflux pump [Sporosarcina sp. 6E9]
MNELIAASITTLDIIVVYVLLEVKEGKFALVIWTALLNMLLPFLGFLTGEFSAGFFSGFSHLLSGVLLGLIGLHMLLEDNDTKTSRKLPPGILALAVSIDAFSVSVSFGMLHLNKILFILASGIFACVFAYIALTFKNRLGIKSGKRIRQFAGIALIIMGIVSAMQ